MIADYTEKHHIIPRCMGGTNNPTNLVRLTPEAHYVAHQLLVKIYPDNHKLVFAVQAMAMDAHGYRVNNKLFGWLRRKANIARQNMPAETRSKISASLKGRARTPEHNAKLSASKKGKIMSASARANMSASQLASMTDERRAKMSVSHTGKIASDKARANMSVAQKGRIISDETKAKLSAANKGKTFSDETKAKLSAATKLRPTLTCPHCNKTGGHPQMKQWHFDKCKHRPT